MKNTIKALIIALSIIFTIIASLRFANEYSYKNRGSELIEQIETFRNNYGRLPNTITEMGLQEPMNDGPYYRKENSKHYIIFFNIGFDETIIYSSRTKEWQNIP